MCEIYREIRVGKVKKLVKFLCESIRAEVLGDFASVPGAIPCRSHWTESSQSRH